MAKKNPRPADEPNRGKDPNRRSTNPEEDKVTELDREKLDKELPNNRDVDVRREFAEAERAGTEPLTKEFLSKVQGSGSTPEVSAMDLDADWERAEPVGEETVGGTVATPGQDVVDYIGDAVGVTYPDEQPVAPTEAVEERDRNRWELDPASSEDYRERNEEIASGDVERDDSDTRPDTERQEGKTGRGKGEAKRDKAA